MSTSSIQSGYNVSGHNLANGTNVISNLTKPNFGTAVKEVFTLESDGNGLSLHETTMLDFGIYPNPVYQNASLRIYSDKKINDIQLSVLNVLGKVVIDKTINLNKGENEVPIKFNGLKNGLYIVSLVSSSFNQSLNIIKIN